MNILSLFDGMSCGQIALNRLGIKYNNYFACEIDKHAIQVTQHNYPNTIQLGDVTKVDFTKLPKIDLLIGGSPCQGFSFAGKQLAFDDPRSKLFFEYVRALKETNPKYFLLENVKMKKEYEQVITDILGVEPIEINSNLVSAQNRRRLYWTNLPNITIPEDKKILLKDIIDCGQVDRDKSHCLDANYFKGGNLKSYFEKHRRQLFFNNPPYSEKFRCNAPVLYTKEKFITLRANAGSKTRGVAISDELGNWRKLTPEECERLQTVPIGYTSCVSNTQRYKMLGNGWTVDVICHILKSIKEI